MDNRRVEERPAARPRRENSAPGAVRLMGVIHAVFGMVFFLTSLPMLLTGWLFALPFLLAGGFFAVNGLRMALGGNPFARRADRPEERDAERTAGSGALESPIKRERRPAAPRAGEEHDHIPSTALDAGARLEQLETLKGAGLLTQQEYEKKRREILTKR